MRRVLLIDDNKILLDAMTQALQLNGFEVTCLTSGKKALLELYNKKYDIVITDLVMPEKEGLETIVEIRGKDKEIPILVISGDLPHVTKGNLPIAMAFGANESLHKPFDASELIEKVNKLLKGKP